MAPRDSRPSVGRPAARIRPLRPILIALALLVALDLVLRSPIFPLFPETFRFRTASTSGLEQFLTFQGRRSGVRVAVLGDSVVQGWQVRSDQTAAAVLDRLYAEEGRAVHVHNLGLSGGRPVDVQHITERVAEARCADVAVVEFDYLAYHSADETPAYPSLAGVADPPKRSKSRIAPVDDAVSGAVDRVWRLAADREYLDTVLLEDFPRYALKHRFVDLEGGVTLSPRPPKLKPSEFNPVLTRRAWDVPVLDAANVKFLAFRRTLAALRAAGIPTVVYVGPVNRALGDALHVYDAARYDRNMRLVRSVCASEGATLVDLSAEVPSAEMIDSLHLLPAGHERLARALAGAIEPRVAAAEEKRVTRP